MIKRDAVDLNLLLVFETVLRERNVSKAARQLGIAQSSLSGALARLRSQLDDELFVRSRGAMVPTTFALGLAPGILEALEQLRGTLEGARRFAPADATVTFTIGSTDYTTYVLLPRITAALAQSAPGVSLRFVEYDKDDIARRLASNQLDLAVGVFDDLPPDVVLTRLCPEHFVGICRLRHPALENGRMSLAAYVGAKHALVSVRGDAVGEIDRALSPRGLSRQVRLVVPHMMALPGALAASDLVAAVPARAGSRFVREGLQQFELPLPLPSWNIQMVWNPTRRREAGHAWLRAVVKAASGPAPGRITPRRGTT